jgi:hypothetical protein
MKHLGHAIWLEASYQMRLKARIKYNREQFADCPGVARNWVVAKIIGAAMLVSREVRVDA